jgi:hypothetical protein
MTSQITRTGVESAESGRWSARPALARLLRFTAFALPVVTSVVFVYAAARLVPPPAHSFVLYLAWWVGLSAAATLVLMLVGRLSRRLLPLAALLRLSLVFPDGAPSRFRTALVSSTVKSLEEQLAEAKRDPNVAPKVAAERLLALVALLDMHDSLTCGHADRVRAYAQTIGRELGLNDRDVELLNWSALLHDVGKLEIPREILTKEGRPTDAEWAVLRRHPAFGAALVEPLHPWLGEWCKAVYDHHERWDGAGYPNGTGGKEISLGGRIVAVADVFDVITSTRTYKQASTPAEARKEIARCAGTQFDPEIVRAFLAISLRPHRLATGPLAWLGHATVLARIPIGSIAGSLSAAALAVGATASVGLVGAHHRAAPPHARGRLAAAPTARRPLIAGITGRRRTTRAPVESVAESPVDTPTPPRSAPNATATAGATDQGGPSGASPSTPPSQTGPSAPTTPSAPSSPTLPGVPSAPTLPSTPSVSSVPSVPSVPSTPSVPSVPSVPSTPSVPSVPTAPSLPAPSPPSTPSLPPVTVPSAPSTPPPLTLPGP